MISLTFIFILLTCLLVLVRSQLQPKVKVPANVLYKPKKCNVFAKEGDGVSILYTATVESTGRVFDSSYIRHKNNRPFDFILGKASLIKPVIVPGLEAGIVGMCVDEIRELSIPYEAGFGENDVNDFRLGRIPPKSNLKAKVTLVEIYHDDDDDL